MGLCLVYLTLLVASHIVRARSVVPVDVPAGALVHDLAAVDGDEVRPERVRMVYHEWGVDDGAGAGDDKPVVVLLHGSPGRGSNFSRMGPLLGKRYRVLAPDLPGFAASTHAVPDYSIEAHARYVESWMEDLGVESYHAVGFSMGGGVALHLADRHPERLLSVTLLSSIGLQEYELLGSYHLNHGVHGIQLAFFWLLAEAVPHFGVFDTGAISYARNFYDTDQRPLEPILQTIDLPFLIIHGAEDVLVPVEAAHEHHRVVPQSELALTEANHFMVFLDPAPLVETLDGFFQRVGAGTAVRRSGAPEDRLAAATAPAPPMPRLHGFALVVWMSLVAVATLISEDLTCIAAGLLVAKGRVAFLPAAVACGIGIFVGDLMLYVAGRFGHRALNVPPLSWIVRPAEIKKSRRWFERRGGLVIFLSRFLPGTRLPTYVTAGLLRMNPLWFTIQLLVPVAIWTPILVALARTFGDSAFAQLDVFSRYALPGFVALLFTVWLVLILGRTVATHRGRRRFVGAWRRLSQWEFWPLWVFYTPIFVYIVRLALRHRSLTVFSAANPGMPAGGGFVGESKSEILEKLSLGKLGGERVARFHRLETGPLHERSGAIRAFMDDNELDYPVVVKPDCGERGDGVAIVRSDDDVAAFLHETSGPAIVQEFVDGEELGVFYVRQPDEERGRIFAITDKRLPEVEGDGRRTVADLVLDDARAVALARVYVEALGKRAEEVPAAGERVRLVEIGTHCRGAVFLDGGQYATPALEDAVDRLSRGYEGFFFGRYDLRAPSYDDFQRGDFRVLELNGVSSEATNVYDPAYSLRDAYRILFNQWALAFEIGAKNRERGVEPLSVGELWRLVRQARAS